MTGGMREWIQEQDGQQENGDAGCSAAGGKAWSLTQGAQGWEVGR